jgi:hypothetical protein
MNNDGLMNFPPERKFRMRKRIHSLRNPKIRKIRYNFRSLLHLWYREKGKEYMVKKANVREDKTLSYEQRQKKLRSLRERDEELQSALAAAPISCGWCSDKVDDLVFEPSRQSWFCVTCYEEAHRLYPDEYP